MHFPQALLLSAALSSLVSALPQGSYQNKFCSTVTGFVKKEKCQTAATAYCSSYLKIATPTVYITKTSTKWDQPTTVYKVGGTKTVPGATITAQETTFTTPVTTVTTTDISTISEGSTTITTTTTISTATYPAGFTCTAAPAAAGPVARDVYERSQPQPSQKPQALSAYKEKHAISSACSCLAIPTPYAITKTRTATVTARSTKTFHKKSTITQDSTTTITHTESAPQITSFTSTVELSTVPATTITQIQTTSVPGTEEITPEFRIRTNSPDLPSADGGYLRGNGNFPTFDRSEEGDIFRLSNDCYLVNVTSGSTSLAKQSRSSERPAPVYFEGIDNPRQTGVPINCVVDTESGELICMSSVSNGTVPGDIPNGTRNNVCDGQYREKGRFGTNDPGSDYEVNRWRLGNAELPPNRSDEESPWQCSVSVLTVERVEEMRVKRRAKRGTLGVVQKGVSAGVN